MYLVLQARLEVTNPGLICEDAQSIAYALITVNRNLHIPEFDNLLYNVTIPETTALKSTAVTVRATDSDRIVSTFSSNFFNRWTYVEINRVSDRSTHGLLNLINKLR